MTFIGDLSGGQSSSSQGVGLPSVSGGISGLASGVNTDSIVRGLMEAAQQPLIRLLQQRQITQWKQDIYQRVNNTLTDLQNNLSSLQLQSTFLQTTTSSSDSAYVSASSNSLSAKGSYSVSVQQLASGATISSTNSLSADSTYANTALDKLQPNPLGLSSSSTTTMSFTLNGETFDVNPQTDTINSILQKINSDPKAGVTGFYDTNTGKVVLQTNGTGSSAKIQVTSDSSDIFKKLFGLQSTQPLTYTYSTNTLSNGGTVDINGVHFQFNTGESFNTIATDITNKVGETGVIASFNTSDQLTFTAATTSQTLNFANVPASGDILNINGTDIHFYNSGNGQTAPAGISIDINGKSASDIASAVASAISGNTTLDAEFGAVSAGSSLTLTAKTVGSTSNFTTSYTPVSSITLGTETLGSSSTPTTQTMTFSRVPSAGDQLKVDGQTIEFYDSATGSAPTGSGIIAIDTNNLGVSDVAKAVASALSNVNASASGDVVTLTAKTNGSTSLGVTYTPYSAVSGTGTTNITNDGETGLYSGFSISNPLNFQNGQTIFGTASVSSSSIAKNAYYTINGYSTSSQSNQPQFNGTTFSLNGVTSSPVSITVSPNTDAIVQTITNFVQQYNETLQYIQGQYNAQPNNTYLPLTAAQAAQMTDKQVTEWNQKAQSGLLGNDILLGSTMSSIENITSKTISDQPNSVVNGQTVQLNTLYSIGISPIDTYKGLSSGAIAPGVTTTGYSTYGLLQINTTQLKAAVEADPTAVMNLFTSAGTTSPDGTTMGEGIATQLYNAVGNMITNIQKQAGTGDSYDPTGTNANSSTSSSTSGDNLLAYTLIDPNADLSTLFGADVLDTSYLGNQISQIDTQATDMESRLQSMKSRYQKEFSSMEQAIQQIDSQSSYIVSMMGGSSTGG